jgi:hypothetical protein
MTHLNFLAEIWTVDTLNLQRSSVHCTVKFVFCISIGMWVQFWPIIWHSICFALISIWLMIWCLKNTSSWSVDVLPVFWHEAVTWVTYFIYWLPLLQMKCPLYPLNMSLLHLELYVPWAKVFWMSCKENVSHHWHCGSEGVVSKTVHCTEHMERNPVNGWWHSHLCLLLYSFPAPSGACWPAQNTCC